MFALQGDDYQSFWGFIGLAGFFFSVAHSVTGRSTKISYAVSGLFLLLALSWPWTKDIFPALSSITTQLAGSAVFWAVLIIVLIGILTISGRPKTIQNLAAAVDQLRSELASTVSKIDAQRNILDSRSNSPFSDMGILIARLDQMEAREKGEAETNENLRINLDDFVKSTATFVQRAEEHHKELSGRVETIQNTVDLVRGQYRKLEVMIGSIVSTEGEHHRAQEARLDAFQSSVDSVRNQLGHFEGMIIQVLRARLAHDAMERRAVKIDELYSALARAEKNEFADADSWSSRFAAFKELVSAFHAIAVDWNGTLENPLRVGPNEYEFELTFPDNDIFSSFELQHRYRTLIVINKKLKYWQQNMVSYIYAKGQI